MRIGGSLPWLARAGGVAVLATLLAAPAASGTPVDGVGLAPKHDAGQPPGVAGPRIDASYGRIPVHFERNDGQTDRRVRFLARGPGYALFLTDRAEAVLSLRAGGRGQPRPVPGERIEVPKPQPGAVLRLRLLGATRRPVVTGAEPLTGRSNYFVGNDPKRWRTDVPHFGRVTYRGVYPGIDVTYYGNQRQLEYDFVLQPGADPRRIRLRFDGADELRVDDAGHLVVRVGGGEVVQHAPVVYQIVDGERRPVEGRYRRHGKKEVGFEVGRYERTARLVIDPTLAYSTYLGGTNEDLAYAIAVDGSGNAYVTGHTKSTNFPTMNPYQGSYGGDPNDAFVTKLSASGSTLVYSTYLGGTGFDMASSIAVDAAGNAYVLGNTGSDNFPTMNPYQSAHAGGGDAFVTKLAASGAALAFSTYLGGSASDGGEGALAVDDSGSVYVTARTFSTDFPTKSPYQAAHAGGCCDAFITKLSSSGSALVYSTYLGGAGDDIPRGLALDAAGSAYVTGQTDSADFPTMGPYQASLGGGVDAFITKLSAPGSTLVYSTYLGGAENDVAFAVALDGAAQAHLAGWTNSTNFPTLNPYQTDQGETDVFVSRLSASGSALGHSTYLGGSNDDYGFDIALDESGAALVTGYTYSSDFPTRSPYQGTLAGVANAFVTELRPSGSSLASSTYLGGSITDLALGIALDAAGRAYVAGYTFSADFPTQSPYQGTCAGQQDVFVAKLVFPHTAGCDFDGDGRADLFWREGTSGQDAVWLMNGAATKSGAVLSTVSSPWGVAGAGDLDGDGRPDVVWRNASTGENAVWFMNGTAVASTDTLPTVATSWEIAGAGDFDGDGRDDLLWMNSFTGETAMWLMNGATITTGALLPMVGTGWAASVADTSDDGKADILWFDPATGQTAVWLMDGTAISGGAWGPTVTGGWAPAGTGDLEGDGKADVVWRNATTGETAVWFMDGASIASAAMLGAVGDPWTLAAVDDFDGDGRADLFWRNGSSGQNAIWFMNGATVASTAYADTLGDTGWTVELP